TYTPADESIAKIGGKWSNKAFQVSAQYEMAEDQTGGDYLFANGLWNINKKNTVTLSFGQQDKISQSYALGYVFSMSKQTNVYAAYGSIEEDSTGSAASKVGFKDDGSVHKDGSVLSLGIRKSF
ncbi:MAG: porin, partial [Gammaproteobacteria bacterium]|nr:porin [Gammaproteobacteria bacterium]